MIVTRPNHVFMFLRTAQLSLLQPRLPSPSLMHPDVGEADPVSLREPAVIVQSYAPFEDSDCAGHALAVSSQRSSVTGEE